MSYSANLLLLSASETADYSKTIKETVAKIDRLLDTLDSEFEDETVRGFRDSYFEKKPSLESVAQLMSEVVLGADESGL